MDTHSVRMTGEDTATMRSWSEQKYAAYAQGSADEAGAEGGWDVIVITAADAGQQAAYEAQVAAELAQGNLPARPQWLVVADKPGAKIGPGGSTLFVLSVLQAKLGDALDAMRVLLIHAGGYSQRLPSMSVCGKIFAPMPVSRRCLGGADAPCTMLQLKLTMFAELPYPGKMIPGVFVTCADDILIFDSGACDFTAPGFTALAHRSPLVTAAGHGVFSLPPDCEGVGPARAFVHKPSEARMREKGLVRSTEHPDGSTEEWAFTDSAFFFDRAVAKKLLGFWEKDLGGNLACEVDCYGDFLQPLGPEADASYLGSTAALVAGAGDTSDLVAIRQGLWELLSGTALTVLPLHPSRFYHIGTFVEYLHFFTQDAAFAAEVVTQDSINVYRSGDGEAAAAGAAAAVAAGAPTVLNCELGAGSSVASGSVVEFSTLGAGSAVGSGCLVSGVELPPGATVPDGTFLQTWALTDGSGGTEVAGFVAHIIATTDDIKAAMSDGNEISWLGVPVSEACGKLGLGLEEVWAEEGKPRNLWEARLFPIAPTAAEAAGRAVALLQAVRGEAGAGELGWLREGGGGLVSLGGSLARSSAELQTTLRSAMASRLAAAM